MKPVLRSGMIAVVLVAWIGVEGTTRADDALVLPKGVRSVKLENKFYFPFDKRYGSNGDVEDAATDFNATLGSNVFPVLGQLENAFGLPPGSANIGNSVVSFKYEADELNLIVGYGVTDKLTAGVNIPYRWIKNKVSARLDSTNATLGKNPFHGQPGDPFGGQAPLIPRSLGGVPLTTDDAQNLLGNGLDVNGDGAIDIPGFGFKRIETWSADGFLDIEAGVKYQYFKSDTWRLAFVGAVRLPTGKVDDPDNLVDVEFGTGAWAILFRFNNDYTGIKNLVLNTTFRYDLVLPDHETVRIVEDVNRPISAIKERVKRDQGDIIEAEASGQYEFLKNSRLSLLYKYGHSFKDRVKDFPALEGETNWTEHVFIAGLSYSTVDSYLKKEFPLPVVASVSYRNRFAGRNNVFKSEYISVSLQIFF